MIKNKKGMEMSMNAVIGVIIGVVSIALLFALIGKLANFFPEENTEMNAPEIIGAEAYPTSGEKGTAFIVYSFAEKNSGIKNIRASIGDKSFNLHDDGKNGDKTPGDNVYSGIFDSSEIKSAGILNGKVFASGIKSYAGSFSIEVTDNSCKNLMLNGNSEDKIDVLFIPVDYGNISDFEEDLSRYASLDSEASGLFSYSPLKEQKNKFNIKYLGKIYTKENLGCEIGCKGVPSAVCCSDKTISRISASCSSDHVILLIDHAGFCGSASSYAKICAYHGSNEQVMVHEFGHTFGGLGDEYSYQMYPGMKKIRNYNFPNCVADCKNWPAGVQAGCFPGCGYGEYFRSAEINSIMYTYVNVFNPVSVYYLQQKLDKYLEEIESTSNKTENQYLAELNYKDGKLSIDTVYTVPAMPSDKKAEDGEYAFNLVSFNKKVLYSSKFDIVDFIIPFYEGDSTDKPAIIPDDEVNYTLSAPYYSNAAKMEIYNKSGKILEIDVSQFAKTCGNNICESYENYDSCSSDCDIQLDNSCSAERDSVCDKDCAREVDPDCSSKLGIYLLVMSIIVLVVAILAVSRLRKKT